MIELGVISEGERGLICLLTDGISLPPPERVMIYAAALTSGVQRYKLFSKGAVSMLVVT